jgi:hypothetical protein
MRCSYSHYIVTEVVTEVRYYIYMNKSLSTISYFVQDFSVHGKDSLSECATVDLATQQRCVA